MFKSPAFWQLLFVAAVVLVPSVGCGEGGPPTTEVTGNVTVDGKPLDGGNVVVRDVSTGHGDSLEITGGQFKGPVTLGSKTLEITAYRETSKDDGLGGKVREQFIPPKYNTKTELKAEVTDDGMTPSDFALNSK